MGDTPLHSAILWAARKSLPVLVLAGADANAHDFAGETPLHQAVRKRDRESLKYLLAKGADPDARDNRGTAALALAVKSGSYDIERDILGAEAEIDARDQAGRTALMEAVSQGDADSSRILVAAGADIMARDAEGDSPLGVAIKSSPSILQYLLTQATVNSSDPDGKTPLRIIVEARAAGASSPAVDALTLAAATGARLDARDRFAATSLHAALRAGDKDTAGRLAKAGADVFARDKDGETPASLAMSAGVDTLKVLVTAAGIAAKDKQGNGWLQYAAIAANTEAATWLLAAGADRGAKNISGETAYDTALKRGKADLAALLKPGS
jgi:ankyrin repeat protein